jgi:DNA-binding transcriptional LysR family regulator
MLACVAGGAGVAMIPASVLKQMPDRARVQVHSLPAEYRNTATWLMWRRDAFTPNVEALKYLIIEQFHDRPLNDELMHPLQAAE